jgi:hypothetical protein
MAACCWCSRCARQACAPSTSTFRWWCRRRRWRGARILNERLAGSTLREIRATLSERLRDSVPARDDVPASELLNVFLQSGDEWLGQAEVQGDDLHLGSASVLAEQPEFASAASGCAR